MYLLMRKSLVVLSGILLLPTLLFALLSFETNTSLLKSAFYIDGLTEHKSYDLLSNSVIPTIADRKLEQIEGIPDVFMPSSAEIIRLSHSLIPESLLRDTVEKTLLVVLPYLRNETDTFVITFSSENIVAPAMREIEAFIDNHEQELHTHILGDTVPTMIDNYLLGEDANSQQQILSGEHIGDVLVTNVPSGWLVTQLKHGLDNIVPYVTGKSDNFSFRFNLRRDTNLDVALTQLIVNSGFAIHLIEDKLISLTTNNFLSLPPLTPGMAWSESEIQSLLKPLLSDHALDKQASIISLQMVSYLTGQENTFKGVINLSDGKRIIDDQFKQLTRKKIRDELVALPPCTAKSHNRHSMGGSETMFPRCLGSVTETDLFVESLTSDVLLATKNAIPTTIPYRYEDFELSLTKRQRNGVHFIRQLIREGWAYDESRLKLDLAKYEQHGLHMLVTEARAAFDTGLTYTNQEFEQHLTQFLGPNAAVNLARFRSFLGLINTVGPAIYSLPFLLILTLGLSGTGSMIARLRLSMSMLAFSSSVIFVSTTVIQSWLLHPFMDPDNGLLSNRINISFTRELLTLVEALASDFIHRIGLDSFVLATLSICTLCLCQLWIWRQDRSTGSPDRLGLSSSPNV